MQSVHRAHFLDELVKGVPAYRAHSNKMLQDLEETEDGVTLYFRDNTTATADVVIGADGVHSTVREFLIGAEAAQPVFSGAAIYRGLVPMNKAMEVLGSEHAQNSVTLCGPGKLLPLSLKLCKLIARQARQLSVTQSTLARLSTSPHSPLATKNGRTKSGSCLLSMESLLLHSKAGAKRHKVS